MTSQAAWAAYAQIPNYLRERVEIDDFDVLRRASMTLHRWDELCCGDGNDYASWSIERDEETGKPYLCTYPHSGKARRTRTPDREAGALRRIAEVCNRLDLSWYHQSDPRGASLYVSIEQITDETYNRGVAI